MIKHPHDCLEDCVLRDFFYQAPLAMYITSCEGEFFKVNPAMERLLGYAPGELEGKTVDSTYALNDRNQFMEKITKDEFVHNYKVRLKKANGATIPCFVDAIVWKEGGIIRGYHGIIRSQSGVVGAYQRYFKELKSQQKALDDERNKFMGSSLSLLRYMSDDLVEQVKNADQNPLRSTRGQATVLFFDIRGSTAIAQRLEPAVFAKFLNDILTDVIDIICGHSGVVNKLLGDGLMATFGCPVTCGNDAFNAVTAGIRIQEYLKTYNDVRPEFLLNPLGVGVGIATGEVFSGIIGSVRCQEYTILGDAVNLASRLESLTKVLEYGVLLEENTYNLCKDSLDLKYAGETPIRGRDGTLDVYGADCKLNQLQ